MFISLLAKWGKIFRISLWLVATSELSHAENQASAESIQPEPPPSRLSELKSQIAVVRISQIFGDADGPRKYTEQLTLGADRAMQEPRLDALKTRHAELVELLNKFAREAKDMQPADVGEARKRNSQAREEAMNIERELKDYSAKQAAEIVVKNTNMVEKTMAMISSVAVKIAKEKGFSLLFDSSSLTNTQLPVVIYAGSATDITEDIKSELKEFLATPLVD